MVQRQSIEQVRKTLAVTDVGIVAGLLERSRYLRNEPVYKDHGTGIADFGGSLLHIYFRSREGLDASFGRYDDGMERKFYPEGKGIEQILRRPIVEDQIPPTTNKLTEIRKIYTAVLYEICMPGDRQEEYGSTVESDVNCLQKISYRIHFGEVVAEAKLGVEFTTLIPLIVGRQWPAIRNTLRNREIELKVLERIEESCRGIGLDSRIAGMISSLYDNKIMPLTLDVEVEYLRKRRDEIMLEFIPKARAATA